MFPNLGHFQKCGLQLPEVSSMIMLLVEFWDLKSTPPEMPNRLGNIESSLSFSAFGWELELVSLKNNQVWVLFSSGVPDWGLRGRNPGL